MASPTPQVKLESSEKTKQYDRQLRLWGDHGQASLETAHVCLINATALGTEILKSLILPGIGFVTIVDSNNVTDDDIGNNFFLENSSLNANRGVETLHLLLEMNDAVTGYSVQESPEQILKDNQDFFKSFSIVIAISLSEETVKCLSKHLWSINVPLIVCRSVGFLGSFRLQFNEHTIVETHPENEQPDLRLDVPFENLSKFLDSFDIESSDLEKFNQVPWVVILYKAAKKWQLSNNRWPMSRKEKDEVKEIIKSFARKDENGTAIIEQNLLEACNAVNTALAPTFLPLKIQEMIYSSPATDLNNNSFWILCAALRRFVDDGNGKLPVQGVIPDMTSSTEYYVKLQKIYREQAELDYRKVMKYVEHIVSQLKASKVSEADVKLFCRYAYQLTVLNGSCIAEEYEIGGPVATYVASHLEEPDVNMVHYILLRSAERFYTEHGRAPGDLDPENDIPLLKASVNKILSEMSCSPFATNDHVQEMCRYGGAELHSVSAFLGGCVAQEAIKMITRQYKPVYNTFIYDGSSTNTGTLKF